MLLGLALLAAGGPLGTDMYLPSLPEMTRVFGTSESTTQLSLSTYMIGMGLGQLIFGPLSDSLGRKRLLVAGMVLGIVASVVCATAPSIEVLVVARLAQGTAGGMGVVLARAIISDRVHGMAAARAFSVLMLIIGVGPVVAPLVGGAIVEFWSWRGVFWLLCAIAVVQTLVALSMPESLPVDRRSLDGPIRTYRNMGSLLAQPAFVGYLVAFGVGFGVLFSFIAGSSVMMQDQLGLSPLLFSWVFAANAVALVAGNVANVRLVGRFGSARLQLVGVGLLLTGSLGLLAVALLGSHDSAAVVPLILVCTLVSTGGNGLNMSNTTALAQDLARGRAGSGSALLGASQFAVAAVVSPMVTQGADHLLTMASMMVACAVLAAVGTAVARHMSRPR